MTEVIHMQACNGQGLQMVRYEDVLLPNVVNPITTLQQTKDLPYKNGDILVCSYPKCGVHWLASMIWKLKTSDLSKRNPDTLLELADASCFDSFDSLEPPRIFFTHLRPNRLPKHHIENNGKILLLLRNPKDVVVSFYYHYRDAKLLANKQTFQEFFNSFTTGIIPFGSYFDYLDEWQTAVTQKTLNIEVLFYEDLKTKCMENLERLNTFLNFNRDPAYLERIILESEIDKLRKESELLKPHPAVLDEVGKSVIFRKGVIGDWKNHFTVAQNEIIDRMIEERIGCGMFKFIYEG